MKPRVIARCCFVGGILVASYLAWALFRIRVNAWHGSPRTWPYPDNWLENWEERLNAAHPIGPESFKFYGESPRVQKYLCDCLGLALVVALGGLIWLLILRRRRVIANTPLEPSGTAR